MAGADSNKFTSETRYPTFSPRGNLLVQIHLNPFYFEFGFNGSFKDTKSQSRLDEGYWPEQMRYSA